MREGNIAKTREANFKEKFTTKSGIFIILVETPIFAQFTLWYYQILFDFFKGVFAVTGTIISYYLSLIALGLLYSFMGVYLAKFLFTFFNWMKNFLRKNFNIKI